MQDLWQGGKEFGLSNNLKQMRFGLFRVFREAQQQYKLLIYEDFIWLFGLKS